MPNEPGSYAHCLVLPNPVGPGYLFTVSEDEHVHARLEIDFTSSSWSGQRLADEVGPVLAQLKREGKKVGLQVPDDAYLVGYVIAGALGGLIDGYRVPEAVHVEVAPPDPAETLNRDDGEASVGGATTVQEKAGSEGAVSAGIPAPVSAPKPPPPAQKTLAQKGLPELLANLLDRASWEGSPTQEVLDAIRSHADHSRATEQDIAQKVAQGARLGQLKAAFEKALDSRDPAASEKAAQAVLKEFPWYRGKLKQICAKRKLRLDRLAEARARKKAGEQLSRVKPGLCDHDLTALTPSPSWELVVDETGSFDGGPQGVNAPEPGVVGLLVPAGVVLPALAPGWHAVEEPSLEKHDAVVQAVLDAKVGVLGLRTKAIEPGDDPWLAAVIELVQWTLRLMPISGETHLTVSVEQRGTHTSASSWQAAFTEVRRQLAQLAPARYAPLRLKVRVQAKDQNPLNGYADAIAFTYGSRAEHSRMRLQLSGLRGLCLLEGAATELRAAWDAVGHSSGLSGERWRSLLMEPDARSPKSRLGRLLERVAQGCRDGDGSWSRFFAATVAHLDSKAVDLRRLLGEVTWLEQAMPATAAASGRPPRLQLAWLTARVEAANHIGSVDGSAEAELEALSALLVDEAPELVCLADLDRCVLETNRFEFSRAADRLVRWADVRPREPGLQFWGRLLSQRGQLAAFAGDSARAEELFLQALAAFERLSDAKVGKLESSQTAAYLAIATMDRPGAPAELVRERVRLVSELSQEAIAAQSANASPETKYAHHVLLRYLTAHGSAEERAAYLARSEEWETGEGHPWPLILAYRALLLVGRGAEADRAEAARLLDEATDLTRRHGPTVRFIGLAIAAAKRELLGGPGPNAAEIAAVRTALPMAPFAELAMSPSTAGRPLELLRACLPFNFR